MALSLIGPGLGDSPLVILSLCSLVLFFVISFSFAPFGFLFFLFLFSLFVSLSVLSVLPYVFMRFFLNIYFLTYQKKKKKILWRGWFPKLNLQPVAFGWRRLPSRTLTWPLAPSNRPQGRLLSLFNQSRWLYNITKKGEDMTGQIGDFICVLLVCLGLGGFMHLGFRTFRRKR